MEEVYNGIHHYHALNRSLENELYNTRREEDSDYFALNITKGRNHEV